MLSIVLPLITRQPKVQPFDTTPDELLTKIKPGDILLMTRRSTNGRIHASEHIANANLMRFGMGGTIFTHIAIVVELDGLLCGFETNPQLPIYHTDNPIKMSGFVKVTDILNKYRGIIAHQSIKTPVDNGKLLDICKDIDRDKGIPRHIPVWIYKKFTTSESLTRESMSHASCVEMIAYIFQSMGVIEDSYRIGMDFNTFLNSKNFDKLQFIGPTDYLSQMS